MDAHYGPVFLALVVVAVMAVLRLRKIGRDDRLPLIDRPSAEDRRKVRFYFALIVSAALAVTAGIAIWSISGAG